uniref:Uncharacterized protein n=1 Tax=Glossina austeni TaxID=7395 RepID=A0A1A9V1S6_GLOAU
MKVIKSLDELMTNGTTTIWHRKYFCDEASWAKSKLKNIMQLIIVEKKKDEQENFLIICIYTTYTSKRLRFVGTNVKPAAFPPLLPTPLFTTVNCDAEELLFKVPTMLTGFVCDFELLFVVVKAMDIVLAELASVILMPTPPTSSSLLLLLFAGLLMAFVLDILQETLFRLLTTDVKVITSLDGSALIGAVAINCNFFEANTVSINVATSIDIDTYFLNVTITQYFNGTSGCKTAKTMSMRQGEFSFSSNITSDHISSFHCEV